MKKKEGEKFSVKRLELFEKIHMKKKKDETRTH
jgi:hypothetical protein